MSRDSQPAGTSSGDLHAASMPDQRRYRWTVIFEAEGLVDAETQVAAAYGEFDVIEAEHLETELAGDDTRV